MLSVGSVEPSQHASRDMPAWVWAPASMPPAGSSSHAGGAHGAAAVGSTGHGTDASAANGSAPPSSAPLPSPYWDMGMPMERTAHGQSPSRYMMYRSAAPSDLFPPPASSMMPPMPPPHAMYPPHAVAAPFALPMHPDPAALARSSGAAPSGYPLLSFGAAGGAYPYVDAQSMPMLMQVPPATAATMASQYMASIQGPGTAPPPPVLETRTDALSETWGTLAPTPAATANMEDLLALSRQAQMEADGGPNANVFVCPHCEKRYVGKHARSIWRRHLQDKHAIPLSVQPRRTRWDRDVNRPRNAAERRERMLESKRRWARKKREQERRSASASRSNSVALSKSEVATNASGTPTPSEPDSEGREPSVKVEEVAPGKTTTQRTALAPFDTNVPMPPRVAEAKSPSTLDGTKLFMPSPLQSTPMRNAFTHPRGLFASPSEARPAPDSVRRLMPFPPPSLTKRTPFSRMEPSPRSTLHAPRQSHFDAPLSPSVRSFRAPRAGGDQFSSPQHLSLTQSLGLAPQSASRGGGATFGSMYAASNMTPMGAGGTPFGRMPMGFTPTINGLLRGGIGDVSGHGFLGGGDLSMFGLTDSPHILRSSVRRSPKRSSGITSSFQSSSERDDDDDDEPENSMRIISPSVRQRVRGHAKRPSHDTPSKVGTPLRGARGSGRLRSTPRHSTTLR